MHIIKSTAKTQILVPLSTEFTSIRFRVNIPYRVLLSLLLSLAIIFTIARMITILASDLEAEDMASPV